MEGLAKIRRDANAVLDQSPFVLCQAGRPQSANVFVTIGFVTPVLEKDIPIARHITNCDPATIIALLDEIERLKTKEPVEEVR